MAVVKAKNSPKKATHPKYNEMIVSAIEALKEKGGSSRLAILNYISGKYNVSDNPNLVNSRLKLALKRGVVSGMLSQVKGTGASGSFKLAAKPKTVKKKPAEKVLKPKATKSKKPKSPKKVVKPKAVSKKLTKKDAIKTSKSPKKSTKKPTMKAAKPKVKKAASKTPKSPKKPTMKAAKPKVKKTTKKQTKK